MGCSFRVADRGIVGTRVLGRSDLYCDSFHSHGGSVSFTDWVEHPRGHEWAARVGRLIVEREMTYRAACTVVNAAMFGDGCLEGEMRTKIEAEGKGSQ